MAKLPTRTSARQNAESLLQQSMKRASSLKQEQDREYEAMVLKTARLHEFRLAKEAADREAAPTPVSPRIVAEPGGRRTRRSKQT
jgi:hypothetical protein